MPGQPIRSSSSKVLSHHRLRDATVALRIVASTGLAPPDLVFELGAGEGMLTAALRNRCRKVVAVEVDRSRWAELRGRFHDDPRVEPVLSDILAFRFPERAPYAIVSNVPFSVTAALMRRLQELPNPPRRAYLVLQTDAAMKWAGLGTETQASVLLKIGFTVDVLLALRRTDFQPRPNVDCVLVRLTRRAKPVFSGGETRAFEAFVRRGFNSGGRLWGKQTRSRPGELTFEDWVSAFRSAGRPRGTP
jgi:23S rRNA (adenine-N6)-dimethyltransferase